MNKKFLAKLLIFCMIFTMLPMTAFGAESFTNNAQGVYKIAFDTATGEIKAGTTATLNAEVTYQVKADTDTATLPTPTYTATDVAGAAIAGVTVEDGNTLTVAANVAVDTKITVIASATVGVTGNTATITATKVYTVTAGEDKTPTVTKVTVTPDDVVLNPGKTQQMKAEVVGTNEPAQTVTWKSADEKVATVNANGVVTAVAVGTTTITATSTVDTNKSGTATVEVTEDVIYTLTADTHPIDLMLGGANPKETANLPATTLTYGEDNTVVADKDYTVTWKSADTDVATVAGNVVTAKAYGTTTVSNDVVKVNDKEVRVAAPGVVIEVNVDEAVTEGSVAPAVDPDVAELAAALKDDAVANRAKDAVANSSVNVSKDAVKAKMVGDNFVANGETIATKADIAKAEEDFATKFGPAETTIVAVPSLKIAINAPTYNTDDNKSVKILSFDIKLQIQAAITSASTLDAIDYDTNTLLFGKATVVQPETAVTVNLALATQDVAVAVGKTLPVVHDNNKANPITATVVAAPFGITFKTSSFSQFDVYADGSAVEQNQQPQYGVGGGGGASSNVSIATNVTGGKVTVSPSRPTRGQLVTITVKPNEGYKLESITITDIKGNDISDSVNLTKIDDNKYTFVMPAGKVTINPKFVKTDGSDQKPTTNVDKRFADVAADAWYAEYINYVAEKGLMQGYENGNFGPNDYTTRAQIVTVLYRLEGEPAVQNANSFTDVSAGGQYYSLPVAWAARNNIVNGYEDGRFGPSDNVTREQIATILYRYAAYKEIDTTMAGDISTFSDAARVSSWANSAIAWAVGEGLMNGDNGALRPQGNATRAEIAALLMRFCENIAK